MGPPFRYSLVSHTRALELGSIDGAGDSQTDEGRPWRYQDLLPQYATYLDGDHGIMAYSLYKSDSFWKERRSLEGRQGVSHQRSRV